MLLPTSNYWRSLGNWSKFTTLALLNSDCLCTHPRFRLQDANVRFITITHTNYTTAAPSMSKPYTHDLATTRKKETECWVALELHESCLRQVVEMETALGITKRWETWSTEYVETLGYLSTRVYQRALEELQRLVVQRLFELHKMNISATGEPYPI
jgi:hypothetical protein